MEQHFCVSIFIFDKKTKKFLLIEHKKLGKWVQPGGHVEINENPEEAAIREVYEETGLKIQLYGKRIPREQDFILPLAIQRNKIKENHIHIDFVYLAYASEHDILKLNESETDGIKWFSYEEIIDKEFNTFEDIKFWCNKILKEEEQL